MLYKTSTVALTRSACSCPSWAGGWATEPPPPPTEEVPAMAATSPSGCSSTIWLVKLGRARMGWCSWPGSSLLPTGASPLPLRNSNSPRMAMAFPPQQYAKSWSQLYFCSLSLSLSNFFFRFVRLWWTFNSLNRGMIMLNFRQFYQIEDCVLGLRVLHPFGFKR